VTLSHRHYLVYSDGSCLGNPGPGGWGVVVIDPDGGEMVLNGGDAQTTNNRMELMGAIEGLRATPRGSRVVLRSDSQYVIKTMNFKWKRNANQDLWKLLDAETAARTVKFEWVRGHDVDPINSRADELAVMAAKGQLVANGALEKSRSLVAAKTQIERVQEDVAQLEPMLRHNETIRDCAGCGAKFVAENPTEKYCSLASCQLKARR
jgi:ribonuclease HI